MQWYSDQDGRMIGFINGKCIQRAVFIWQHEHGMKKPDGYCVDHIDGDTLNDDIKNLRLLTLSQNCLNEHKRRSSHGYRGIYYRSDMKRRKRWSAQAQYQRPVISLGCFLTKEEAAKAWDLHMINDAPRELVLEHDMPGNIAGRFIPTLNILLFH